MYPQYRNGHSNAERSSEAPLARVSSQSVHDARQLLAIYPMASATPTTHVARHLGNLTLAASAPTYIHPFYHSQGPSYPPGNPPPYTEYASEVNYLASQQISANDSAYWEHTRNEAVRLVGDRAEQTYPQFSQPSNWPYASGQSSNFQTNAFAQSVFQRTAPSTSYPTPPPPGISSSSSSLAHALGEPVSRSPVNAHKPEQSSQFFNEFLIQKTRDYGVTPWSNSTGPQTPTRPRTGLQASPQESPDPLVLRPSTLAVTPSKRKLVVEISSPSVKRFQISKSSSIRASTAPAQPPSTPLGPTQTPKKAVTLAYIEVPPKPWLTPPTSRYENTPPLSRRRDHRMDSDDLCAYDSEDDLYRSSCRANSVKLSARRTGDRDERAPLEKLAAFLEDVFEAEDVLPPEPQIEDLPSEFFSSLSSDCSRPMLHPNAIKKLTKYIGQVARPTKRMRQGVNGVPGTPRGKGRTSDIDSTTLSRVLKMLERSVRAGEDLDPLGNISLAREKTASPKKSSAKHLAKVSTRAPDNGEARSSSKEPRSDDGQDNRVGKLFLDSEMQLQVVEVDLEKLTRSLDIARDSTLAAECCIALLGSDRLTKQLYSEELITVCLNTIKNNLTKLVYPFVETAAESGSISNPTLRHLIKGTSQVSLDHRRQMSETFQALSAVVPGINNLVCADVVSMSDSIIIQAVYIAIGPFFVTDSGGDGDTKGKKDNVILNNFGKSAMRGLRLDALSLIRNIFANHEEQRSWIIEEILSSLIKLSDIKQKAGQFRLRNGQSIRTVSALLLQLVQTSAHDVRIQATKIGKTRQQQFALRRQESLVEVNPTPEPFLDDSDMQEVQLYTTGLESATRAAKTIIIFLTSRSGKGKATKNSNEAEYRTIFDNLIYDLLAVLYWPEWPAASLLLSIACKYMVSSLDDVKTTSQSDNNASKTMALDHLGVIAARIRSSALKVKANSTETGAKTKVLKALDEIIPSANTKELDRLLSAHLEVAMHLCKRSTEDQAYDSARELTAATLGQEIAVALKQINSWLSESGGDEMEPIVDGSKMPAFGKKIKTALREVWKDPTADVFDIGSQEEVARIDRLSEEIGTIQGLRNLFQPILNVILTALDAPPVFMRTKALRALGQIVTSDPSILSAPNVRRAIESHLLDSSPAVRDAAVELIGKYMIDSPEVAGDYYQKIADRIADTGLGVRKRVIKLLKSFYGVTEETSRRIDITTRLVLRMLDEDETVKDLAIKTIEELWFGDSSIMLSSQRPKRIPTTSHHYDKGPLLSKVAIVMGVTAHFKDRQSPLEDMLHSIMADKSGAEASSLRARYSEICETLIDGLVDASDLPGFTVVNCIRTIYLFASAYPPVLSGTNATTLLPYLKNATTPEEQVTSDYLLRIFRASIPHMPRTAAKFGQELQLALQPMIIKPSTAGGVTALQETVACMCTVVQSLTHDFTRLVALIKSCNMRLQQAIARPSGKVMAANETRSLSVLIFIVALLCEHCDFDQLRVGNETLSSDLNTISQGSIIEHIYTSLLKLYEKYPDSGLRGRILQCLGFLFRAQPTLMTLESSAIIMDAIFASPEEEGRGRLLKIMQEFLTSEAAKHSANEKANVKGKTKNIEVNMEELVGNTDGFADSGVSSAVVQRYLPAILDAALSQHLQIQAAAIDVLSFTVKQGLAHPLQSFPVIVALETSPNPALSARANALHAILHGKHTSLLNTRYVVSAKAAFDYQKTLSTTYLSGESILLGYRMQPGPIALLQRWYLLVREKRPSRQDFIKALVKAFDVDPSLNASQYDVDFARFMAENFSAFDYKTLEEVLTVIKHLTSILSTAGMQIVAVISPSNLISQLHGANQLQSREPETKQESPQDSAVIVSSGLEKLSLMRSSVIVGMIMLLKAHLKAIYGLSEEKCSKFAVGKKSALGDKAATRRSEKPISWIRMPFATSPILATHDMETQQRTFLNVWNEDGQTAEPEDDLV